MWACATAARGSASIEQMSQSCACPMKRCDPFPTLRLILALNSCIPKGQLSQPARGFSIGLESGMASSLESSLFYQITHVSPRPNYDFKSSPSTLAAREH